MPDTPQRTSRTQKTRTKAKATAKKKPPAKKPAAPRKCRRQWKAKWLEAFRELGMVSAACEEVKVGRQTVYDARKDEDFAAAWDEIENETTDAMEREAYRRGVEGVVEPVVSAGKHVTDVRKYSDTLLIFMLKARKPGVYRENVKVEHSGQIDATHTVEIPDTSSRRKEVLDLLARAGVLPEPAELTGQGAHADAHLN
jgi:alpha-galactosidase/6-phospho-beta-glucosidase family protein